MEDVKKTWASLRHRVKYAVSKTYREQLERERAEQRVRAMMYLRTPPVV
jgi:hypothetical protein